MKTAAVRDTWLGIDGALGGFSAATVCARPGIPPRTARGTGNDALERGLTLVEEVLDGLAPAELAGIAVGTGPGSFTGLRIALAFAKSLAFAANVPLAGVSSYDAYEPPDAPLPCATFVHGRAGIACVRVRTHDDTTTLCGAYDAIAAAVAQCVPPGTLDSYGAAQGAAPALGERGIIVRPVFAVAPPALAIALRASRGALPSLAHALRPDYGEQAYYARDVDRKGARPET